MRYESLVLYDEELVRQIYRVSYYSFQKRQVIFRFLLGAGLICLGIFFISYLPFQGIAFAAGCWFLASGDFPARMAAEDSLRKRQQPLPKIRNRFYEREVELESEGSRKKLVYSRFSRLVEDKEKLFLIVDARNICVVEPKSLKPAEIAEFKSFLEEKTGLVFKSNKPLILLNLLDIINYVKH